MMTLPSINLLLIEDNPVDALLINEIINHINEPKTAWQLIHADRLARGLEVLGQDRIDAILLDLGLPDSQGYATFTAIQKAAPTIPIIMVTATDDEALAIRAVQEGAQDYLVKGSIHHQVLVRSIRYAIERKHMEQEQKRLIKELKEALGNVKTLSGLLPICAGCKKIRDDKGYWHQVEMFISEHTDAIFTHGLCPDCAGKMYPDTLPDKAAE